MRRYIYLLLFVLSVCGGMVTSCSRHEVRFRIGVSQCSDDEWRHQMNNEMLREALFYDGVEVEIRTVKDDNARQAEDIRHFIEAGVDLLIVAPNEAEPITPVVEEAYDRGIPVIVVDRRILFRKVHRLCRCGQLRNRQGDRQVCVQYASWERYGGGNCGTGGFYSCHRPP